MSMELLTAIQFLMALIAYLFVTLAIPCAVLHKRLSHYRLIERVLFYFIAGNFYVTNLVFALQLLYLSNAVTIWIGLVVIPFFVWVKLENFPLLLTLQSCRVSIKRIMSGTLGIKGVLSGWRGKLRQCLARNWSRAIKHFCAHWLDWLLIAASACMVLWVYGIRMLQSFGYAASDIPVHLYWVNGLSDNDIFIAGVYPFGMHGIIYALCTAFRMDSYVIFRVFGLLQCLAVHMVALVILKLCCKSRYAAYAGFFLYTIGNYITSNNFSRYFSALPQEFSMVFIFPTVFYAFCFFKQKRRELEENLPEKGSMLALTGLVMSFSLSFTAHFYGAIVAGIFCVGIAIGYSVWLVRRVYLTKILLAGLISVAIAVLPMAVAYVTGTPLEGSLYWATSVMSSGGESEEGDDTSSDVSSPGQGMFPGVEEVPEAPGAEESTSLLEKIPKLWHVVKEHLHYYILANAPNWYSTATIWLIMFLSAAGVILLICRVYSYGAMLLSTGAFMGIMTIMLTAGEIGLPVIMGADRLCIFYAYSLILLVGLSIDVVAYAVSRIFRKQWIMQAASLLLVLAVGIGVWQQDRIRMPLEGSALETNEAVTCLTNIIATEKDYQWTIFSANDETNMVYGHGFHYELSTFLHEIGWLNGTPVTVPTEVAYFFIEKIPLDYAMAYAGSGQMISRKGAERPLPNATGLGNYQGENRWIIMSHMYYWAQEFQRLYPQEMTVYLESDQFICYRLEQNTYSPYDLAIDYGYN